MYMEENKRSKGLVWGFYSKEQIEGMRSWLTEYIKVSGGVIRTVAREIGVTPLTLSAFILDGTMFPRLPTAIKLEKFMKSKQQ